MSPPQKKRVEFSFLSPIGHRSCRNLTLQILADRSSIHSYFHLLYLSVKVSSAVIVKSCNGRLRLTNAYIYKLHLLTYLLTLWKLILSHMKVEVAVGQSTVANNRARQFYKNISMLFLFPVKYGKLSTGVNA